MIYGYMRLNQRTNYGDDLARQKQKIQNCAESNSYIIDEFIFEIEDGMADYRKRQLGKLIEMLGQGDVIITSDNDRLSTNKDQELLIKFEIRRRGGYLVVYEAPENIGQYALDFFSDIAFEQLQKKFI